MKVPVVQLQREVQWPALNIFSWSKTAERKWSRCDSVKMRHSEMLSTDWSRRATFENFGKIMIILTIFYWTFIVSQSWSMNLDWKVSVPVRSGKGECHGHRNRDPSFRPGGRTSGISGTWCQYNLWSRSRRVVTENGMEKVKFRGSEKDSRDSLIYMIFRRKW
jgi:hypothetical protein